MSRDEGGDVTNYLVMAKTKADEKVVDKEPKNNSVSEYHLKLLQKPQYKIFRRAISEEKTNRSMRNRNYCNHRKWKTYSPETISGPIVFQTEKKIERALQIGDKITPKNCHCRRGVDGKYTRIESQIENNTKPNQKIRIGVRQPRM